eukprot:126735_1
MKPYLYLGLDDEQVPDSVTHVIVDESVTAIKQSAFDGCYHLVSIIMRDNVKRIEDYTFNYCIALRFLRLSRTLEYIGYQAFYRCDSLEALLLPSTVKYIEERAFDSCQSLRLIILPHDIELRLVREKIIPGTGIYRIAEASGVAYRVRNEWGGVTDESIRRVNEWLLHYMDAAPFHKLCYTSSITVKEINDYLSENGNDSALQIDTVHGMTPLHILTMNPHAPADAIAALLTSNMEAVFFLETSQQKTPLEYARDYNVDGLIAMIAVLCNHKNSPIAIEVNMRADNGNKRRRIE